MWIEITSGKPVLSGWYKCFGTLNRGTEYELLGRFTAFYDGEVFTDKQGEDLTGINDAVEWWFDFDKVKNPIIL